MTICNLHNLYNLFFMKHILREPSIWLLIFLVGFPQVSETIYTPSLPELAIQLKASGNQMQQTLSIYFVGFAVGVLLWGILSDRIGRRPSMLWGILLYILGSLGCLFSQSVAYLLLARFIQATGAAAGSVVTQTVMRDCYDDSRRPQMFAKVSAVLAFSPAVGPLMGSVIAESLGVEAVFMALVLIGVVALFSSYRGLNETKPEQTNTVGLQSVAKRMLTDRTVWIYATIIGVINGIIFSYYGEAPFIFINHLNFSVVEYGMIGFSVALASFVGAVVGKLLLKRLHFIEVMFTGCFTILFACILFIGSAAIVHSEVLQAIGFIVSIFLIMMGIGIALPSSLSNALLNYKDCLGIAGAFLGLLYYIEVSLITGGMSMIHNESTLTLPIYILAMTLLLISLLLSLKRSKW